jgi:hypothetical protein
LKKTIAYATMALLLLIPMASAFANQSSNALLNDSEDISIENTSLVNDSVAPLELEGVWSFRFLGGEQITAVLHPQGQFIIGSAKFEGDRPWNAVIKGSLSGQSIVLAASYLLNTSLVSLQMVGSVENEDIRGNYALADDQGRFEEGLFLGTKINTDLSAYAPAQMRGDEKKAASSVSIEEDEIKTAAKPVTLGDPKYKYGASSTGAIPGPLGVGFVGDGTAGAGGMGLG